MARGKIIVIGGGAAGMMAALTAARAGAPVALWEKNGALGKKLRITGKGRCNLTNDSPVEELLANIPHNAAFLRSAFSRFDAAAAMAFFAGLDVPLKTERGRRVFPQSDRAEDIVLALQQALTAAGVRLEYGRRAAGIELAADGSLAVLDALGNRHQALAVVLATGGLSYPATGSTGDGYAFAAALGHALIPARAALVPLETVEDWPKALSGLSLKNVRLQAWQGQKLLGEEFGELLFTHFGLSGPIVLRLSGLVSQALAQGAVQLAVNLKPALTPEQLQERLQRDLAAAGKKQALPAFAGLLPRSLLPPVLQIAGISASKQASQISKGERQALVQALQALPLQVRRVRPLEEGIVTAGGVEVRQVDPKTMQSKLIPGLFFAGELLDVDGLTGGFNLQIAWSTGYLAGDQAAELWRQKRAKNR